jgi:hypothetical protein
MISDPDAGYLSAPASTREDHPLSAANLRNIGKRRGSTGQNRGISQNDSDDIDDDDKSKSSLSDKSSLFDPQSKLRMRIEEVKAKAIAERNLNDF